MYILVVFLPLFGFLLVSLLGNYFGRKGSVFITTIFIFFSFLFSLVIFYEIVLSHCIILINFFTWMDVNGLLVSFCFLFDSLTSVMLVVVTSISLLVHFYSIDYMRYDPHISRFMGYLSLFTFFMLILVTSNNFVQMFMGWEGVGLASYLLINFWHTRLQANKAAMKAIIVNKLGDFGLSLGLVMIFFVFHSFDYHVVFSLVPTVLGEKFFFFSFELDKITLITFFIFIGAVGKSAQIGLHTWLPDAMEGPTPVSALIHAATMVTAGVFVLLRCSPILEFSNVTLFIITVVGSLTAFMAATIGIVQNDIKKVIAYSTCSQLGYMVMACGLSNYAASLFHLMNHAFFKALLFLSAGVIIHAIGDEQDMRKLGGLVKILPVTYVCMLIGSLSLMGFPFFSGFYSKDMILEFAYGTYFFSGIFAYWLGVLSAFFTAFYSTRLLYMTFLKTTNSNRIIISEVEEGSFFMIIPLVILTFASIFVGYIMKDLFLGLGVDTWNGSLFQLPSNCYYVEAEFLPFYIKLIPFIFTMFGVFIAIIGYGIYDKNFITLNFYKKVYYLYSFLVKKWYFDIIYNEIVVKNVAKFGYFISFKLIDRSLLEILGPLGLIRLFKVFTKKISSFQSGLIYHYIFCIIVGLTSLLLFVLVLLFEKLFVCFNINLLIVYVMLSLIFFVINGRKRF
jgi:proton-translocating NADH-quinone oxidoreductase chain L